MQMKIVFNTFRSISPKIFDQFDVSLKIGEDDFQNYAYQMLLPLYKVCEGFAGKVIPGRFYAFLTYLSFFVCLDVCDIW